MKTHNRTDIHTKYTFVFIFYNLILNINLNKWNKVKQIQTTSTFKYFLFCPEIVYYFHLIKNLNSCYFLSLSNVDFNQIYDNFVIIL